jgi:hypothetical protein
VWYKRAWVRKLRNRLIVMLLIGLVLFLMYRNAAHDHAGPSDYNPVKAAQFMKDLALNNDKPQTETMSYGGVTWYKMAEQSAGSLWMEPGLGQIAVKTSKGEVWLSNPSQEDQTKDETKGIWKNNESSPFLLTYMDKEKQIEETANVLDTKAAIAWKTIPNGVGIRYSMDKLGFVLYIEFTYDDKGFVVHVPQEGVTEGNQNQIINLSVLPFFGATMSNKDGFLFVPDRSGGLIEFDKKRADLTVAYDYPIYGNDQAVPLDQYNRDDIVYPVFGMKRGDQGFISIVEEGETKANVVAMPGALKTAFNHVYTKFKWRNYYAQQQGLNKENTKNMYETYLNASPLTIRYLFLEQGATDYVAMAKQYRTYLMEKNQLITKEQPEDPPLILEFVLAASEQPSPLGAKVIVVSTISEVQAIVDDLYASGIHQMRVGLRGWMIGGFSGALPKRFPVESKIGGDAALKVLQKDLQGKQIPLNLEDDLMVGVNKLGNGFSVKSDAVRQISGKVMKNYQNGDYYNSALYYYLMNPERMVNHYLLKAIKGWKDLSITGVTIVDEYGDGLYSDYNKSHLIDRKKTMSLFNNMYDKIRADLGWVATTKPYAFTVGHVDYMLEFPTDSNYDLIVSEQVPFYPIVLHGLIGYSSHAGNLRTDPQTQFLRNIEYGTLPYFTLTAGDVRDLRRTNYASLISGQYKLLKQEILMEYQDFKATGKGVWNQLIAGHRKLADGVYETSYGNGTRILVNYNELAFQGSGYEVKGMSYLVLKGGDTK